jgi:hypothetical protein
VVTNASQPRSSMIVGLLDGKWCHSCNDNDIKDSDDERVDLRHKTNDADSQSRSEMSSTVKASTTKRDNFMQ